DCCAPAAAAEALVASDATRTGVSGPLVEILYFDGCPNHHPALALVERLSRELEIDPEIRLVNVPDHESARRLHFLGSPTIRVGAATTVGFMIVFGTIGTAISLGARQLIHALPWAGLTIGIALVVAGAAVLSGKHLRVRLQGRERGRERAQLLRLRSGDGD